MMGDMQFHFDFGSPNAYLSHAVLPGIEQRAGIAFQYVPVLLGGIFKLTNNRSPMEAFAGVRNKLEYERLELRRFTARHGITRYQFNPHFPVNTLALMRGAVAARHLGVFGPYADVVFRHMWELGSKMDDPAVLRSALDRAALDAEGIIGMAQTAAVKAELAANTQESVDRGAFGAPTFFVGNEMFFGKDRLRDVEEAMAAMAKPA